MGGVLQLATGVTTEREVEVPVDRVLFSELRTVTASAATSPIGLVPGLVRYLDEYPHGCTEQVVSRAKAAKALYFMWVLGQPPKATNEQSHL